MPTWDQINGFRARREVDGEEVGVFELKVLWLTVREINRLRDLHALPQYTLQQVITAIDNVDLTQEPQV